MNKKKMAGILAGVLILTAIPTKVFALNSVDDVTKIMQEETDAKGMYDAYAKKFPDVMQFEFLAHAESRHINAAKKLAELKNYTLSSISAKETTLPNTKEEAIKNAIDFENKDIAYLEDLVSKETDSKIKKILTRLLESSKRHKEILEGAQKGETFEPRKDHKMKSLGKDFKSSEDCNHDSVPLDLKDCENPESGGKRMRHKHNQDKEVQTPKAKTE